MNFTARENMAYTGIILVMIMVITTIYTIGYFYGEDIARYVGTCGEPKNFLHWFLTRCPYSS